VASTPLLMTSVGRPACPFKALSPRRRPLILSWPLCKFSLVDRASSGK
jgi:hypothetical protein